ncbi:ABC transporter substrate-binding protein [Paracoccus sp. NGMCC 1.201697]|uniref:ABC transporter substrate-binding protein n=1 Tax=Paracoccus broussonetiae subsp. drimophilus TaxID=3373869 RepID=A0ABW7LG69_9RHOB
MTVILRLKLPLFALTCAMALGAGGAMAKDFIYCSEGAPEGFDPALYSTNSTWDASAQTVYDGLTRYKRGTSDIEPALAESWDVSADNREYTFHLRKGVKFHTTPDFTPTRDFNADDVIFSFERQMSKDGPWAEYAGASGWQMFDAMGMPDAIKEIVKIDDQTVKFVLNAPDASFLAAMALNFGAVLSKEYADALSASGKQVELNQKPVGTGPFAFVAYQQDAAIRYRANADWWDGKPPIDNLVFAITQDPTVRITRLKAGECLMAAYPAPAEVPALKADKSLNVMEAPGLNVAFMAFNTQVAPWDRPEVRRAVAMAINRPALVDAVYQGMGQVAETPLPPTIWGYNDQLAPYPYDPGAAKAALEAAGVKDAKLNIWAIPVSRSYMPNGRRAAEMIQADLAQVGIAGEIVSYEWGEYLKRVRALDRDGFAMSGGSSDSADPDNLLGFFLNCPSSSGNTAYWCNAEVQDLLKSARAETQQDKRAEMYERIQQIVHDEAPVLPLANSRVVLPMSTKVKNYVMDPLGAHRFDKVDLE